MLDVQCQLIVHIEFTVIETHESECLGRYLGRFHANFECA